MMPSGPEPEPWHDPAARDAAASLASRLREWRRREDASRDHAALAARVGAAIRADAAIVPAQPPHPRVNRLERPLWFAAGLAVAVAVAWFVWPPRQDGGPADWPPSVRFAAGQPAEKAALVAGLEATFGDGLAWIAEHDDRVELGLVPGGAGRGRPVAVRVVVLTRRAGEAGWRAAWQSDVVARDEAVVDVAAGPGGAGRLRLWTHALPDGGFAIDGQLTLARSPLPLEASYGGVQRPGEPRRVTGDRTGDVEWQIIQTIVPLGSVGLPPEEVG
jgi:hypothetical protein